MLIYLPQAIGTPSPSYQQFPRFLMLSSAHHLPLASATTNIGHRHRSITIRGLGHILMFRHRHQSPSATPLITTLSPADLYFINS